MLTNRSFAGVGKCRSLAGSPARPALADENGRWKNRASRDTFGKHVQAPSWRICESRRTKSNLRRGQCEIHHRRTNRHAGAYGHLAWHVAVVTPRNIGRCAGHVHRHIWALIAVCCGNCRRNAEQQRYADQQTDNFLANSSSHYTRKKGVQSKTSLYYCSALAANVALDLPMTSSLDIPILETERLILRGHTRGDFAAYAAMWADPAFAQFSGGTPLSEEDAWARFLRPFGHWHLLSFGFWAIEEKLSRRFVGDVGFAEHQREIDPSLKGIPEIGWALAVHAQGKGYATEAARAAIQWGDKRLGPVRTACTIHPANLASVRVAEKCGYRETTRTLHKENPSIVYFREPQCSV